MTPEDCIEELAPAVVVRAALFPLRNLFALADAEAAALAAEAGTQSTPDFERGYEAAIQRQRRTLSSATIENTQFMRALCLTNDDLSRRVAAKGSLPAQRNKAARHLDATLYRYLSRAVWRTEPCDLWAGVGLGLWADESRVDPDSARYALAPDLRPYQFIVQTLARTAPYFETGIYKLNPTLHFDAERRCWRYTVRVFDSIVRKERPSSPGIDALLRALADMKPASFPSISAEFRRLGVLDPSLDEMLAALQGLGLLVGGLAFPRAFSSAWDALMAVPSTLQPEHARCWRSAVIQLRSVCRRIERKIETISLAELHRAMDEARSIPSDLARALGVGEPSLPRSVLRCDTRLPFSIRLGPEMKAGLAGAAAEYDHYERNDGVDLAARAAHRSLLLKNPDETPAQPGLRRAHIPTQELAWRAAGADPVLGQRLRHLSRWLVCETKGIPPACDEGAQELKPSPVGGLIVRPRRHGFDISGATTEICAAYGRFGQIWYGLAHRSRRTFEDHPLHQWYQSVLAKAASEAGIQIVEYVGPCEAMPNGLARPQFDFPAWDRWGTTSSWRADQLSLHIAPVPLAFRDGYACPISLTCFSPVNVGFSEPRLECLLLSSFREIPSWIGPGLPMECELFQQCPSPALTLRGGNTVRLRRTLLHGAMLAELVAAGRAQRFLLWQALARTYAWPQLLLLSRDGGPPLPVVRDSPLAVEAALQGLYEGVTLLSIQEPDDHTWLIDTKGDGFAAEIIVPFLRRSHAWSELAAAQSGSSRTDASGSGRSASAV